jgi:hypothetical protein
MITAGIASVITAGVVGFKYLTRKQRLTDVPEGAWVQYFDEIENPEYSKALQDYKANGKSALKRYEEAV